MRFVIYDDESMEAITVVSLPITERDAIERGHWRVAVPTPFNATFEPFEPSTAYEPMRVVDLWFERFVRKGQVSVMCFTKAADLAMLLEPAWLPGQRPAVAVIEDQRDSLVRLLMQGSW